MVCDGCITYFLAIYTATKFILLLNCCLQVKTMHGSRGGGGGQGVPGTDPPREAIGPKGSNCFSREVRTALCEIH